MANHYHTENPKLAHDLESWSFPLYDQASQFMAGSGVFSRETIGHGSHVLTDAFGWENLSTDRLLDVDYDYEPIGLFLAVAIGRSAEMVDVGQRTVRLVQMNAQHNQVTTVGIHSPNVYETLSEMIYMTIISNPLIRADKKIVHGVLTGAFPLLKVGGVLTVAVQKKQGAPSAKKKVAEVFGNVRIVAEDKGYYILRSTREAE